MSWYIDPGTGSMLFAVLIGILGTMSFLFKSWLLKLKFYLSRGKVERTEIDKVPIVIYSDDKRYWNVFEPLCREFNNRNVKISYLTSSEDDPVFECGYVNIEPCFIGKGNKAFSKLNFLNASIVLCTTPGLDVYQWKRSKNVDCYIHMLHAPNEISGYRMFGTDYFDVLLLSGDFQEKDVRELERIRNLPEKEIYRIGIPYMDEMAKRLKEYPYISNEKTVLLAPSWGTSAILSKYGGTIIDKLLATDYHIIIRPHPQSFVSERGILDKLMKKYPSSEKLEWNTDNDNFEVLRESDIIISDFSGVIFDFSLVYDKPVIYTDTEYKNDPYDSWWLSYPTWTFDVLPLIGEKLTAENFDTVGELIESCLKNERYAQGRETARNQVWEYRGTGATRAVDYIENKYKELIEKRVEG